MLRTLRQRCWCWLTSINNRNLLTVQKIVPGNKMSTPSPNACSKSGNYVYSCNSCDGGGPSNHKSTDADEKWRSKLTDDEYRVARERGTEPPFSGEYYKHDANGVYTCVCCGSELFSSKAKYDSGSGWPSFFEALKSAESSGKGETGVGRNVDESHGMRRVEIVCKNCDAHLGHVFEDGPQPTGERFCVNSLSLKFKPQDQ